MASATQVGYNGTQLGERDVVFVSLDYCLGNFGFLARIDLDADDHTSKSGNFGVQDMLLALKWVQGGIENFGGDPSNVLIFGESAGGHVQGIIMASPLARNLFHKVIMESRLSWDTEHGTITIFDDARLMVNSYQRKPVGSEPRSSHSGIFSWNGQLYLDKPPCYFFFRWGSNQSGITGELEP